MCGICISLSFRERSTGDVRQNDVVSQNLLDRLKQRGPNHFETLSSSFSDVLDLHFISSVLQLRGSSPSLQPITDSFGNILLWNGEIFDETLVKGCQSDTKFLSERLFSSTESSDVLSIIESIKGPFAFVFYQSNGLLWFGRDVFGRRSLLLRADPVAFCLCSVSDATSEWKEVSARGVYCLDLKETSIKKSFVIFLYPWSSTPSGSLLSQNSDEEVSTPLILTVKSEKAIKNPISNILNKSLPSDELLEVFKFSEENFMSKNGNADYFFKFFLEISEMSRPLLQFEEVLSNAVRKRVQNHQRICKKCYTPVNGTQQDWTCGHASVGVLFSGGLDSIVIACLADRYLKDHEPIDLLNVAFASNINVKKSTAANRYSVYETPDRITGRNGVVALRKICPNRTWNFVEVNITEEELINERRDVISHLLRPSCTVLDDSIGCALWFASHGKGILASDKGCESYSSPVRVLLVGMGADEQLGGYSRHRAKFNSFGWPGLIEELTLELDRISSRNLGRDDRIIADNGVESRYPFLDEDVVSFLNSVPVWMKMNLNYPRGMGEKLLLRLLAYKLGLLEAAALPKRAIQFGSRIARIENTKEKGSDVCERLKNL